MNPRIAPETLREIEHLGLSEVCPDFRSGTSRMLFGAFASRRRR